MQVKLKIIKSKRRTISLSINNDAELVARVPYNYDKAKLDAFIKEKSNWIVKHIKEVETNRLKYAPFEVKDGAVITILGKEYSIVLKPNVRTKIVDDSIVLPNSNSKKHLIDLIKKIALNYLSARVKDLSSIFGFEYSSIKVGSAKTVWGSCSGRNDLNFTYKLMFAPYFVVDYIIIHELSHTKIKNHSTRFYQLVKKCMPNYKLAEQWLKDNKGVINFL